MLEHSASSSAELPGVFTGGSGMTSGTECLQTADIVSPMPINYTIGNVASAIQSASFSTAGTTNISAHIASASHRSASAHASRIGT